MVEAHTPKILILEANDSFRERAVQILEDQGWDVTCESVSKEALDTLKQSESSPYHLFISNFKLPKMAGDDILKHAKSIAPMTQRMLMVDAEHPDMVVRAINKAEINACIVTPASDQDLVNQVASCLDEYDRELKHKQLKRVITHQNKQMFVIAQRLKKKDQLCRDRINDQKKDKVKLSSKLRQANRQKKDPASLHKRTQAYEIPITQEHLEAERKKLTQFTQDLFKTIANKSEVKAPEQTPAQILSQAGEKTEDSKEENNPQRDIINQILRTIYASAENEHKDVEEAVSQEASPDVLTPEGMVDVKISEDRVQAFVSRKETADNQFDITLNDLLELLRQKGINFGIVDDENIETWIKDVKQEDPAFEIAAGKAPILGKDGSVEYSFTTDFTNPGKIMDDGRMDFRDRGAIPYVSKGDMLATKTPAEPGKEGMSISGEVIEVDEPFDPVFLAGSGVTLSEDELSIHADVDGRPHLDPMGEISVNPELPIEGDVDFKTGNIDFKGNITVNGTVKEGFTVKGVSLTANEIEGATIDLSGDLYVSDGITDTTIVTVGNVFAKFINNSTVKAFGNVVIQKEIIDSKVLLSGQCENPTGVIIASKVSAKSGVDAGRIGTDTSKPAHFRVGVDDHIDHWKKELEAKLEASLEKLEELKEKIEVVESQDQELYGQITQKAQEQENIKSQIKTINGELEEFKRLNDKMGVDQALEDIKLLTASLKKMDRELDRVFNVQDRYAKTIETYKKAVEKIENRNKNIVLKKKGLRDFANKTKGVPSVNVQRNIIQDTVVQGPNSSITLKEDRGRCKIAEKAVHEEGLHYYEMEISEL